MKQVLKNPSGLYFVVGAGFTATCLSQATRLTESEVTGVRDCGAKFGFTNLTTENVSDKSYAVVYIRKGVKLVDGKVVLTTPNAALNQIDPSKRRFATIAEACTHGARFATRRARRSDPVGSGTAGHQGWFWIETNDPVNSAVNPATGLTNSL